MSVRTRAALERFARVVVAGAISAAVVGAPALFDLIPAEAAVYAVPVLTAALAAADKFRRTVVEPDPPAA